MCDEIKRLISLANTLDDEIQNVERYYHSEIENLEPLQRHLFRNMENAVDEFINSMDS
jgi:hypothetical protein